MEDRGLIEIGNHSIKDGLEKVMDANSGKMQKLIPLLQRTIGTSKRREEKEKKTS